MKKALYCAALTAAALLLWQMTAHGEDKGSSSDKGQLPPGMTVQKMGNKDAYKSVLPEGTVVRWEGDVRVIEGVGEYTARRFVDIEKRLADMSADIKSLRQEVAQMRNDRAGNKREVLGANPS